MPDDVQLTPQLYLGRAHSLIGLGRYNGAKQDAIAALHYQPHSFEIYVVLGEALLYLRDYGASVESFERAEGLAALDGLTLSDLEKAYLEKAREAFFEETMNDNEEEEDDSKSHTSTSTSLKSYLSGQTTKPIPKLKPPRFVSRSQALNSPLNSPPPPKAWTQSKSHVDSSISNKVVSVLRVGKERPVVFVSEQLGIKLNRASDGIIRIISVLDNNNILRKGDLHVGDVVREAVGVDLRRPITNLMWGDTVALMKMASRPITLIVAKEYSSPPVDALKELEKAAMEQGGLLRHDIVEEKEEIKLSSMSNGDEAVAETEAIVNTMAAEINDTTSTRQETAVELEPGPNQTDDTINLSFTSQNIEQATKKVEDEATRANDGMEEHNIIQDEYERGNQCELTVNDNRIEECKLDAKEPATTEVKKICSDESNITDDGNAENLLNDRLSLELKEEVLFLENGHSGAWTKETWFSTAGTRKLVKFGSVKRYIRGTRFMFWTDQILDRKLAIFSNPDLILLLRPPKNIAEVRQLLKVPKELDVENEELQLQSFLVAEHVFDPQMFKLRLSYRTTPTSIWLNGVLEEDSNKSKTETLRNDFCFDLITPNETFVLSTAQAVNEKEDIDRNKRAFEDTKDWETNIIYLLEGNNNPNDKDRSVKSDFDNVWMHQIILGTLHSHVVTGNVELLEKVLFQKQVENQNASSTNKSCAFVNDLDKFGLTALHYACKNRSQKAVSLLVSAGADCIKPTIIEQKTPCHLSAEYLDEKSLSIILSSTYPERPDSNSLDRYGRTPMYLAATLGKSVGGLSDPSRIGMCLSALEAWGGQMFVPEEERLKVKPNSLESLPHPIHCMSSTWKSSELKVLLSHCQYRYPLKEDNIYVYNNNNISVAASFHYPLHACLVSLRKHISKFIKTGNMDGLGDIKSEPPMIATIGILLKHGIEPNERIECIDANGEFAMVINDMVGFTPLQILAAAVFDFENLKDLSAKDNSIRLNDHLETRLRFNIEAAAEVLIRHGARITVDTPPTSRPRNKTVSVKKSSLSLCPTVLLPPIDRSVLKIDKNSLIIKSFGGQEQINTAKATWSKSRSVKGSGHISLSSNPGLLSDSCSPGGTDTKSCALCWKSFGLVSNRKHTCRASLRHVCDECSSRFVLERGDSFRVSDGQFLLATNDLQKSLDEKRKILQKERSERKMRLEAKKKHEESEQDVLFGRMGRSVRNFFMEEVEVTGDDRSTKVDGMSESLKQTQNAFNERGEKLNNLSEKTDALKEASIDFAKMAKELHDSQKKGLFW